MLVILNAGARGAARDPSETRSKVAAMFGAVGIHPQLIIAAGKEVGAIARQAVAENEKTIVAGGGDGTVSTVAAELTGTGTTLGVLPLGRLNHFARDLRIPFHLEGAVRIVVDHHAIAVDVGQVNERIFINNSSIGIYPHIVALQKAEQLWLQRGRWRAQVSLFLFLQWQRPVGNVRLLNANPPTRQHFPAIPKTIQNTSEKVLEKFARSGDADESSANPSASIKPEASRPTD